MSSGSAAQTGTGVYFEERATFPSQDYTGFAFTRGVKGLYGDCKFKATLAEARVGFVSL